MTDPKRATGRTLGLALQALGKAVENPGTEVEFINHNPQNYAQHRMCKRQIELLAETLHLDVSVEIRSNKLDDRFRPEPYSLYVKSNWVSPYSQRTPLDEAFKRCEEDFKKVVEEETKKVILKVLKDIIEDVKND